MSKIMKTTKTTMNSVMSNNNNTVEVKDMRIEMYETNSMEAIRERIIDGTATLKDLTAMSLRRF